MPAPPQKRSRTDKVAQVWYHRQRYERHSSVLRLGLIHAADSREPAMIRNISARSLVAQVYSRVSLDDRVEVELQRGRLLHGRVIWAEDWTIEIAFAAPIDLDQILAEPWVFETEKRSRPPRFEVRCPAKLNLASRLYKVRLGNISQGGARIDAQRPFSADGPLVLTVPDLPPLRGSIRWRDGATAGVSFDEEIPFSVLAEWLEQRRARTRRSKAAEASTDRGHCSTAEEEISDRRASVGATFTVFGL